VKRALSILILLAALFAGAWGVSFNYAEAACAEDGSGEIGEVAFVIERRTDLNVTNFQRLTFHVIFLSETQAQVFWRVGADWKTNLCPVVNTNATP
jgi:hypothetical protein